MSFPGSGHAEGGGPSVPPPSPSPQLYVYGTDWYCPEGPRNPENAPRRGRSGDRKVELPVLGADEEALPLVLVEHVRGLAGVLGIGDRHASLGKVRYFHAGSCAACAALEPAEAIELCVHHPFPFDWLCRISQVSSSRTCWISSTEAAGDSAVARIRSKASAQVLTSRSFSR